MRRVAQSIANFVLSRRACIQLADRFDLGSRLSRFYVAQIDRHCREIRRLRYQVQDAGDEAHKARVASLLDTVTFLHVSENTGAKTDLMRLVSLLRPQDTEHRLIRLGGANDGGYLVPDDLTGLEFCFSPGVSDLATFEKDCEALGMKTFLADGSVAAAPDYLQNSEFIQKFIGSYTSSDMMAFEEWFTARVDRDQTSEGLLQMDIEGAEIETLLSIPEDILRRFRMIIVEFHPKTDLLNAAYLQLFETAVRKLCQHFTPVHLHPNNFCPVLRVDGLDIPYIFEATFLRKDRARKLRPILRLPHPLDQRNAGQNPELYFSHQWVGETPEL